MRWTIVLIAAIISGLAITESMAYPYKAPPPAELQPPIVWSVVVTGETIRIQACNLQDTGDDELKAQDMLGPKALGTSQGTWKPPPLSN